MTPEQRDLIVQVEFNLENLEEDLELDDPARADVRAALRLLHLAVSREGR